MNLYSERQYNDFVWFKANYTFLFEQYGSCYLAICDNKVIGCFATYSEAVNNIKKNKEIGDFIVQECNGNESAYSSYNVTTYSC